MVGSQSGGGLFLRDSDGAMTEITCDTISIPGATGLQVYSARDINNSGQVVGSISYTLNSIFHREAFRWDNGVMTLLHQQSRGYCGPRDAQRRAQPWIIRGKPSLPVETQRPVAQRNVQAGE